jgi:hypothetical protein
VAARQAQRPADYEYSAKQWALLKRLLARAKTFTQYAGYSVPDLVAIVYKYDSSGRLLLESKVDMKRRGMPSPESADACALNGETAQSLVPVNCKLAARCCLSSASSTVLAKVATLRSSARYFVPDAYTPRGSRASGRFEALLFLGRAMSWGAMAALLLVAEHDEPTMFAPDRRNENLNRHVERVFNPSRKDNHRHCDREQECLDCFESGRIGKLCDRRDVIC